MNHQTTAYLDCYLDSLPESKRLQYTSFSADFFCADQENARICADLIRQGKKTATCSLKSSYTLTGKDIPHPGHLQVVTVWDGNPTSIITITDLIDKRFCDVDAAFAFAEGEGDLSLAW